MRFLLEWYSTPLPPEPVLMRNRYRTIVESVAVSTSTPEMVTVIVQVTVCGVLGAVQSHSKLTRTPGLMLAKVSVNRLPSVYWPSCLIVQLASIQPEECL